jgi:hypothetical protein
MENNNKPRAKEPGTVLRQAIIEAMSVRRAENNKRTAPSIRWACIKFL